MSGYKIRKGYLSLTVWTFNQKGTLLCTTKLSIPAKTPRRARYEEICKHLACYKFPIPEYLTTGKDNK